MAYHQITPEERLIIWETASICFSESFEALISGLQDAVWELGGVPHSHQTDCLSAAVHKLDHPEAFTARYAALMRHYGLEGRKDRPGAVRTKTATSSSATTASTGPSINV